MSLNMSSVHDLDIFHSVSYFEQLDSPSNLVLSWLDVLSAKELVNVQICLSCQLSNQTKLKKTYI